MSVRSIAACALFLGTLPAHAFADDISGRWVRGDGMARIRIGRCGRALCAVNTWIKDPQKQGEKVGDRLIFKLQQEGDAWAGTAYDPQRKLTLSATLKASGNHMTSSGCVLGGMVCRSTQWTRM